VSRRVQFFPGGPPGKIAAHRDPPNLSPSISEHIPIPPISFIRISITSHCEYNVDYVTPEEMLNPAGHHDHDGEGYGHTPFIKKIVCIAVDECHLIWDWEMFRPKYQMIKNNQDTAPLLKVVVPPGIHAFPQIPKTLIFLEDVEVGIRPGNELQYHLMELTRMNPSVAIVNYYSMLDAESTSE
jgi:hypothetical protein